MEAEFGKPQWAFGTSTYGFDTDQRIVCSYATNGVWHVALLDTDAKRLEPIDIPFIEMGRGDIKAVRGRVVLEAGASSQPMSLISIDLDPWNGTRCGSPLTPPSTPDSCRPPNPSSFPLKTG